MIAKNARNCVFTLNNYTEEEYNAVLNWDCKYLIVGKEVGEQNTPHLQGYVEWLHAKKFTSLKNLNPRIHWEKRRGTAKEASDYCKKEGYFYEKGTISCQGKRSDLEDVAEMVEQKVSLKEIAQTFPTTYIKYHKGIEKLINIFYEDRNEKPYVHWRWGKTGTGKTYGAVQAHPSHYIKDGTKWWDGYEQQEAIIIDDFDGKWDYRNFLRLLDKYKYQGETKFGYVKINSPYIYITCEHPPSHFWDDTELSQILRRIDKIVEVKSLASEVAGNTNAATSL